MATQQFVVLLDDLDVDEAQAAQLETAIRTAVADTLATLQISAETQPLASALPEAGIAPAGIGGRALDRILEELRDRHQTWGIVGRPPRP